MWEALLSLGRGDGKAVDLDANGDTVGKKQPQEVETTLFTPWEAGEHRRVWMGFLNL